MAQETGKKLKQYFIAVIPPAPVFDEALKLKEYFKEQYNSKASLNSPPHITLHMPFRWKEEKEEELINKFSQFIPDVNPFTVQLSNFNSFPPRVIFIDIQQNDALAKLQKQVTRFCKQSLHLFNANYKEQPFHPHITLAFRDLKKSMFAAAWKEFEEKEFLREFTVDRFHLLKHNGKFWEIYKAFSLNVAKVL